MAKRKILITGSSGNAGAAIARRLMGQWEVVGFDLQPGPYTNFTGSITDWPTVKAITQGVDAIVHTASLHAPHVHTHSREQFVDTNIKGALYLLEAALQNDVRKLVYTSTTSLYGEAMNDQDQAVWITEETVPKPRDIYDITKIAAEELCKDCFDTGRLHTISLRVSRFWDEPLPDKVFYRMYRGVDVEDVAVAHQLALDTNLAQFEVFNISAQSIFTQNDLYRLRHDLRALLEERIPELLELFGEKGWALPAFIDRVYVIEKATQLLGFQPADNIKEYIRQVGFQHK